MFENLKDKLFSYLLRRNPLSSVGFPHYENIRSVLILFESDLLEKNTTILALRDRLLQEDKDVVLLGYAPKKDISSLILPQRRILGLRDVTFWGGLQTEAQEYIRGRKYDLLIDLTQHPCLPLQYAAMYARADFKTGMRCNEALYHFIMEMPPTEDPTPLFDQILYYLKSIRSNDSE